MRRYKPVSQVVAIPSRANSIYTSSLAEMASELSSGVLQVFHINSYIRGYHAYMDVWTPVLNEELILKREPTNDRDSNAVAVKKEVIVGHVPFNLAPFLFRRFSGATQIVDLPRSLAIK